MSTDWIAAHPPASAVSRLPPDRHGLGTRGGSGVLRWSHRLVCLMGILALSAAAPVSVGAAPSGQPDARRSLFLQAERALRQGDRDRYRALREGLADYPLLPYLVNAEIRGDLEQASPSIVHEFLRRYADSPLADSLRRDWLRVAYERGDFEEVTQTYVPTTEVETRCRYLQARRASGAPEALLDEVQGLWLFGRPLPAVCDPIVEAWQEAGRMTPALIWTRVGLAMEAGQPDLARQLSRHLQDRDRQVVEAWVDLRRDPTGLVSTAALGEDRPETRQVIVDVLARWARRAPDGAIDGWRELAPRYGFSPEQVAAVQKAIGRALVRVDDTRALEWLGAVEETRADTQVKESAVLSALRLARWSAALDWIRRLPAPEQDSDRWRYWSARAIAQQAEPGEATARLTALSGERSFYGFLAANQVRRPYALASTPVSVAPQALARIEGLPGVERARELLALDRTADARREWSRALRDLPPEVVAAAGVVAHQWGWHDQAIAALARARQLGDLEIRFPLAHRQSVVEAATTQGIDPAWAFGVLRQESAFGTDARSTQGALGLMQLLPSTAREVAGRLKMRLGGEGQILEAETNIRLGTAYLRRVLDSVGGHLAVATAAYNAGPQRARSWIPGDRSMPADLWVESVPFPETQAYVRQVLTYMVIYRERLGLPAVRLVDRLPPIGVAAPAGEPAKASVTDAPET